MIQQLQSWPSSGLQSSLLSSVRLLVRKPQSNGRIRVEDRYQPIVAHFRICVRVVSRGCSSSTLKAYLRAPAAVLQDMEKLEICLHDVVTTEAELLSYIGRHSSPIFEMRRWPTCVYNIRRQKARTIRTLYSTLCG